VVDIEDPPLGTGEYRYDLLVIGIDSVIDVIKGVEVLTNPVMPSTPASHLVIGWVLLEHDVVNITQYWINKVWGTSNVPAMPDPPVSDPPYEPTGTLGSKTNPLKLNVSTPMVYNGYISQPFNENWAWGSVNPVVLPAGGKLWFEVDTLATTGLSATAFGVSSKFWNNTFAIWKCMQDKATDLYGAETLIHPGSTGLGQIVYDDTPDDMDDYRYLYAVESSSGSNLTIDVWATVVLP
jgi:hypothetical protein